MSLKNPVTPPRIDPGSVRLEAQRRNYYAIPAPNKLFIPRRKLFECLGFRLRSRSSNHSTETLGDNPNRRLVPSFALSIVTYSRIELIVTCHLLMKGKSIQEFKRECFLLCTLRRRGAASINLHFVSVLSNVFCCTVAEGEYRSYKVSHKCSFLQCRLDRGSLLYISEVMHTSVPSG
jgi:hypothetical protein